jgi:hypothetical protein
MERGDEEDRWWPDHDRAPGWVDPADVAARAAAAARAFAALEGTDIGTVRRTPPGPPSPSPDAPEPVRPDAVLRGRTFSTPDAGPDRDVRSERPRALDYRRWIPAHPDDAFWPPAPDEADVPSEPTQAPVESEPPPAPLPSALAEAPTADLGPEEGARDRTLLHVLALAIASGALVAPLAWPVAVALGALAGAAARSIADHGPGLRPLVRRAGWRSLGWLRPRSALWLPVLAARTVLIAIAVPALLWAARWLVVEGTDGLLAAARTGVWSDGFRVMSGVVCFMLVTGVGDARPRRAAQLGGALRRGGRTAAVVLTGAALAVVAVVAGLAPRLSAGGITGTDGLAWVPASLHGAVDGFRDDIAVAEVQSASECLSSHQDLRWRPGYTRANGAGDEDVARLTADPAGQVPTDADVATAALALHNLLAPWVDTIVLESGDVAVLVIDRHVVDAARPVTDAADLVGAATTSRDAIVRGAVDAHRAIALDCASAPVP